MGMTERLRDVAVIGGGVDRLRKVPQRTHESLGREAVLAAMKDAGIKPKDVGFASCGTVYGGWCVGQRMLKEVGISDMEFLNVENACASGASAFREAWLRVAAGQCDIAIAGGVESMTTSPVAGKLIPPPPDDVDGQLGLTVPMFFALMMRRHMHEYGTTPEQFARVSVKNHDNGCLNPYSQYQRRLTVEDILASRMVCDPLSLLQCCPNSDGAAAVVLCANEIARRFTSTPMVVASFNTGIGRLPPQMGRCHLFEHESQSGDGCLRDGGNRAEGHRCCRASTMHSPWRRSCTTRISACAAREKVDASSTPGGRGSMALSPSTRAAAY